MIINGDGEEVLVSNQQIQDCCHEGGSQSCGGGDPMSCLKWGVDQDIQTEDSYPTQQTAMECRQDPGTIAVIAGECRFKAIQSYNETALLLALQEGPVSVLVDANSMLLYMHGTLSASNCDGTDLNFALQLVAYDAINQELTLRNMWSTFFGENGYVRIQANVNCLSFTTFPAMAIPSH